VVGSGGESGSGGSTTGGAVDVVRAIFPKPVRCASRTWAAAVVRVWAEVTSRRVTAASHTATANVAFTAARRNLSRRDGQRGVTAGAPATPTFGGTDGGGGFGGLSGGWVGAVRPAARRLWVAADDLVVARAAVAEARPQARGGCGGQSYGRTHFGHRICGLEGGSTADFSSLVRSASVPP